MSTTDPDLSIPSSEAATLLYSFTTFLTLALHNLLYHRALYPATTFLTARALNLPVHQSRHPGLCTWINDSVDAVSDQLREGTVRRIAVTMYAAKSFNVLERWVFDVEAFPAWGDAGMEEEEEEEEEEAFLADGIEVEVVEEEKEKEGEQKEGEEKKGEEKEGEEEEKEEKEEDEEEEEEEEEEDESVNWTDVNEALRGALRRVAHAAEMMPPLPAGSTFTLSVELRDKAAAAIIDAQHWIPSQHNLQPPAKTSLNRGASLRGQNITPVRSVQAGPLFFECWIEKGTSSS